MKQASGYITHPNLVSDLRGAGSKNMVYARGDCTNISDQRTTSPN